MNIEIAIGLCAVCLLVGRAWGKRKWNEQSIADIRRKAYDAGRDDTMKVTKDIINNYDVKKLAEDTHGK